MTHDEIRAEFEAWVRSQTGTLFSPGAPEASEFYFAIYLAAAMTREKRIAELEASDAYATEQWLRDNASNAAANSLLRERIAELESQTCRHGWRGTFPDAPSITTPCPTCGSRSLFIGSGGHLTCSRVPGRDNSGGCSEPGVENAVDKLKARLARMTEAAKAVLDLEFMATGFEWESTCDALFAALDEQIEVE
jgi:hypothetical protein